MDSITDQDRTTEPSMTVLFMIFLAAVVLLLVFLTFEGLHVIDSSKSLIAVQVLMILFIILLAIPDWCEKPKD
jgi:hypothetical protein